MVVYIRVLKSLREVREVLRADGWDIKDLGNRALAATHPQVVDEDNARERLSRLDLLASSRLRISFESPMAHGATVHRPPAHHTLFLHAPTRCL